MALRVGPWQHECMSETPNPDPTPQDPPLRSGWRGRKLLVVADGSAEGRVALYFAARRAMATGARVTLLRVIEPVDFQHWAAVEQRMQAEARQEAEAALYEMAGAVNRLTGGFAEYIIREGRPYEELKDLIAEEPDIRILILGAAAGKDGPGPILSRLEGELGKFPIPVTIVPGSLSIEDVDALT